MTRKTLLCYLIIAPILSTICFDTAPLKRGEIDPLNIFEIQLYKHLLGNKTNIEDLKHLNVSYSKIKYPTGKYGRKEYFKGKKSVHAPFPDMMMMPGRNALNITKDRMQTAMDAFAIFIYGSLIDILHLPPRYVLMSAHAISMIKIAREKLTAIWIVVKGNRPSDTITVAELELYRPLFKYLSGREMARLNLSDENIVSYIGTHEQLSRHQVGVVTSAYIKLHKKWYEPSSLNIMNNLICGLPMNYMRRIPTKSYLLISTKVFYHIRSCEELQRQFLLTKMTQTHTLGKPFSWTIQEVSRLGLIVAALDGPDLASINPYAFAGLTAQVINEIDPENLQYLTPRQISKLSKKAQNVLSKKLQKYQTLLMDTKDNGESRNKFSTSEIIIIVITVITYTIM